MGKLSARDGNWNDTPVSPNFSEDHRNRIELILERQTNTAEELPKYEEALNMARSVEADVREPKTEEGLGKVKMGEEESPPCFEVATEGLE